MKTECPICETEKKGSGRKASWFSHFFCEECATGKLVTSEGEPEYPEDYFGSQDKKFTGVAGWLRRAWHHQRSGIIRELLGKLDASLYDIGCGDGEFISACLHRGIKISGCEPQPRAREQAEKNLQCQIDGTLFSSKEQLQYDAVTVWHVIEHVENPGQMIRDVRKHLKTGGLLAVSTVNIESWQARLFGTHWLHLDPPRHLWVGGRKAVEELLEKNGFDIEMRRSNFLEFGPVGFVDSFINVFDCKRDRLLKCLKAGFGGITGKITWLAAAVLTPLGILFSAVETIFGKSATFEIYARKSDDSQKSENTPNLG